MNATTLKNYEVGHRAILEQERNNAQDLAKKQKEQAARLRSSFADLVYALSEPIPQ